MELIVFSLTGLSVIIDPFLSMASLEPSPTYTVKLFAKENIFKKLKTNDWIATVPFNFLEFTL